MLFRSPVLIAELFEAVRLINSIYDGKTSISSDDLIAFRSFMHEFVFDILGLKNDLGGSSDDTDSLMQLIIDLRNEAKKNKDFVTSDSIREQLTAIGIQLKDSKDGTLWNKI